MAGFYSTVEGGARSPALSPFHGFTYQTTYWIPWKEKEVQARPSVADDIRARTAETVESLTLVRMALWAPRCRMA